MVYIDDFNAKFGKMTMCHMIADTRAELLDMARKIGVNTKWIQEYDTAREHFDICLSKKAKALNLGAKEVRFRELNKIIRERTYEGKVSEY
ncbi:DUF4031 domain-containing protein [Emticicia sp. BO119]|uniref:DUF4031 domain-containing protein n=1 Tax=Emticicia sp. BO119 TaxID=2757768 RepID=UPI0015F0B1F2|nr:DUF4031 domain-containing protein [Emticicia sp. BO119]MBA4852053.1 DUF4031 domain-containing protein [Emticicia sp. BO119]